ncbi:MAG: DUF4340 domain-containing protein [Lachnospiraceae bacterium]|nr:DUF4340 domain-containing protein [Lachnospiraceae bacterium]
MKKNKQLIIVILLLVVCVGGYFGVKAYNANQEKKEEAKTMTPVNLQVSDITSFSYVNEGETLSFERDGENWIYTGDTSIDLSEDSVEGMLEKACTLTSTNKMTAENLSDYGFDEPTNVITLNTANDTIVIKIGMFNNILSQYYIAIGDSTELYLVDSTVATGFDQTIDTLKVIESTTDSAETTDTADTETTTESTENEAATPAEEAVVSETAEVENE